MSPSAKADAATGEPVDDDVVDAVLLDEGAGFVTEFYGLAHVSKWNVPRVGPFDNPHTAILEALAIEGVQYATVEVRAVPCDADADVDADTDDDAPDSLEALVAAQEG